MLKVQIDQLIPNIKVNRCLKNSDKEKCLLHQVKTNHPKSQMKPKMKMSSKIFIIDFQKKARFSNLSRIEIENISFLSMNPTRVQNKKKLLFFKLDHILNN